MKNKSLSFLYEAMPYQFDTVKSVGYRLFHNNTEYWVSCDKQHLRLVPTNHQDLDEIQNKKFIVHPKSYLDENGEYSFPSLQTVFDESWYTSKYHKIELSLSLKSDEIFLNCLKNFDMIYFEGLGDSLRVYSKEAETSIEKVVPHKGIGNFSFGIKAEFVVALMPLTKDIYISLWEVDRNQVFSLRGSEWKTTNRVELINQYGWIIRTMSEGVIKNEQ